VLASLLSLLSPLNCLTTLADIPAVADFPAADGILVVVTACSTVDVVHAVAGVPVLVAPLLLPESQLLQSSFADTGHIEQKQMSRKISDLVHFFDGSLFRHCSSLLTSVCHTSYKGPRALLLGCRGHRLITQNRPYKRVICGEKLVAVKVAVSSNEELRYKFSEIVNICVTLYPKVGTRI